MHFYNARKKYRRIAIGKYMESLPKRWTFIIALIALALTNFWQYALYKQQILANQLLKQQLQTQTKTPALQGKDSDGILK